MTPSERLDAAFGALADPTRRAILARLAAGEASVTELARPFAMSQPAVSKHLKVLERAGLIARGRGRQGRARPARGGAWRIAHRTPDGSEEHGFRGEYREIVPPERIVWTFEYEGWPGQVSVETLTLEERDGKTTLTSTSVHDSVEARDAMLESGMEEGAAETMERLDEYLE